VRVVIFCHSLVSDWNHGNAHFLRGVVSELLARGHAVRVLEPADGWSRANLVTDHGPGAITAFRHAYPQLHSDTYSPATLDVDRALAGADLALVHEWTDPAIVAAIGRSHARRDDGVLLFHDSHHRSVTDPAAMAAYDLSHYDGVLAFGDPIRDRYLSNGWSHRVWTWHEAADTRVFRPYNSSGHTLPDPMTAPEVGGDVVWIGNWGDEERTSELEEFLFEPVRRLGLRATLFGVRYPEDAQRQLAADGIEYRGWLPNYLAPAVFARFTLTVHVPRRPYLEALPGIPTIRPFEALACGIPLISARWDQTAGLFTAGEDFLVAHSGDEMTQQMERVLRDEALRARLARRGLTTIRERHTCAHRVDQLMDIHRDVLSQKVLS
jgi:spore maturation protein CgeB